MLFLVLLLLFVIRHPSSAHATNVQEVVSPKGIRAWLVEEHSLPLLAVRMVFTGSGSAYDPKGKEGLTGMASALLLEGAGDMDSQTFNETLENHAIELNFGADEDLLRVSMETLSEHKDLAFSYMAMALSRPRFDDAAIERVRAQTLSVIREQEQEPGYILHRQWEQLAFANHPYGRPTLGTRESITAIGKQDLVDYTQHYISRENILISVVGDITPAELGRLLDANFGQLSEHYTPQVTVAEVRLPDAAQQVVTQSDIPQTMVMFGANGLKRDDPNYYAAYVMNHIVGGGGALTSRLGIEIREKRGLAYGVGTELEPMAHSAGWRGGFATRNDKVGDALKVLRQTLREFADKGPTDREMADAKKHLIGAFMVALDSNGDIASFLTNMQVNHLGRDYFDKRNALINGVTRDEVKAQAQALLQPEKLLVVMVGKPNLDSK